MGTAQCRRSQRPVVARKGADLGGSASSALRIILLSSGFAVFGAVLTFLGDDATARSRFYTSTPQFKVCATLIIGVIASLPAVWRVGIDLLRRLGLDPRNVLRSRAAPALAGIVLVVEAAVLAGKYARSGGGGSTIYGSVYRTGVIYFLAVTAVVPAFLPCGSATSSWQMTVTRPEYTLTPRFPACSCVANAFCPL